jgi:hypothetical protein
LIKLADGSRRCSLCRHVRRLSTYGREGHDTRRWMEQLDQRLIHYLPVFDGALGRTRTAVPLTSESAGSRITASAGVRPATTSTVRP